MTVNCWEFKRCGREPGGVRASELGVCSASTERSTDGVNGGANGGRACWAIAGTLCGGKVQGTFAVKAVNCLACEFYLTVVREEGPRLAGTREVLARLHGAG
jgi:hypothetical protein